MDRRFFIKSLFGLAAVVAADAVAGASAQAMPAMTVDPVAGRDLAPAAPDAGSASAPDGTPVEQAQYYYRRRYFWRRRYYYRPRRYYWRRRYWRRRYYW